MSHAACCQWHPTARPARRPVRRAFTLVEIIVVVTIIALLATLIAPRLWGRLTWAKNRTAEAEVKAIETAVNMYVNDESITLTDDFDLQILLVPAEEGGGCLGPYFQKADDLLDPWKNDYVIRVPGELNYDFDIVSLGADGIEGTEDDIVN